MDADKQAVVSTVAPKRKFPIPKKILLFGGVVLLIGAAAGVGFWRYNQKRDRTPTVELQGKKFKAAFLNIQGENQGKTASPTLTTAQQIEQMEKELAQKQPTYEDYRNLAQLYYMAGNYQKAIEYYGKAKQAADPKMPDYQSFIKTMDDIIKNLQEKK
jgi:tetratricopeptide (TPR) repeat protein